jgi:hypothetical protein
MNGSITGVRVLFGPELTKRERVRRRQELIECKRVIESMFLPKPRHGGLDEILQEQKAPATDKSRVQS